MKKYVSGLVLLGLVLWSTAASTQQPGGCSSVSSVGDFSLFNWTVWRPNNGVWYVVSGFNGARSACQWGEGGDIPVVTNSGVIR